MLHPDHLFPQLESWQVAEWQAYFKLFPFGQDHTDVAIAKMAADLVNVHRGKNTRPAKPIDYLAYVDERAMSSEEIQMTIRGVLDGSRRDP